MNYCHKNRTASYNERDDGILVTIKCVGTDGEKCGKFIAAQLFDDFKVAKAWAQEKVSFRQEELTS